MVNDWIDQVIARAEELRAAGIKHIKVGDCEAVIGDTPEVFDYGVEDDAQPLTYAADPLDDPETFGGVLPTLHRRGDS